MADVKISELTLASAVGDSVVPASNAAGNTTSKVTLLDIANLATPANIGAATQADINTSIATLIDSDVSVDSANATAVANIVTMNASQYANTSVDNTTLYIVTD